MNISGPAAVAKPEMLFYAPGDLTVTIILPSLPGFHTYGDTHARHRLHTIRKNKI